MSDYSAAVAEGDDIREPALQIALYGKMFATVVGPLELAASGPNCIKTLAENLLQAGYAPERAMAFYRAGEHLGRTTLKAAAQQQQQESLE
jgi:hypothetical protein